MAPRRRGFFLYRRRRAKRCLKSNPGTLIITSGLNQPPRVVARVSKKETVLPIEPTPDHYESVEVANARAPCLDPKNIPRSFGLFGKQGTG